MSFFFSRARRLFDYGDLDDSNVTGSGGGASASVVGGAMSVTIDESAVNG
jgi:hypothetical protein